MWVCLRVLAAAEVFRRALRGQHQKPLALAQDELVRTRGAAVLMEVLVFQMVVVAGLTDWLSLGVEAMALSSAVMHQAQQQEGTEQQPQRLARTLHC